MSIFLSGLGLVNHLVALAATEVSGLSEAGSGLPGSGIGQSVGAGSPFTDYVAGVALYSFITGVLITGMLGAGFLIVNLGLLSKRPSDWVGKRVPGDVGILQHNIWPIAPYEQATLPAEEEDQEDAGEEWVEAGRAAALERQQEVDKEQALEDEENKEVA